MSSRKWITPQWIYIHVWYVFLFPYPGKPWPFEWKSVSENLTPFSQYAWFPPLAGSQILLPLGSSTHAWWSKAHSLIKSLISLPCPNAGASLSIFTEGPILGTSSRQLLLLTGGFGAMSLLIARLQWSLALEIMFVWDEVLKLVLSQQLFRE